MSRIRSLKLTYGVLLVALGFVGGRGLRRRRQHDCGHLEDADTARQQRVRECDHGKQDGEHRDRGARHEHAHEGVQGEARGHH